MKNQIFFILPKISLIIAFYKSFDALDLIFRALQKQKFKDFEIIIAEDDNNPETFEFLKNWQSKILQKIKHVNHIEKKGFRKNLILNEAVKISDGEILVFIDGDIIPHKNMLKVYAKNVKNEQICTGRRVFLDENQTNKLYKTKNLNLLQNTNLIFSKSKSKIYAILNNSLFLHFTKRGIVGCNWGITKDNLLSINGFDEDYTHAGVGEDTDVRWRLRAKGIKFLSVRYAAIVYHLYHKRFYSKEDTAVGFKMLEKKQIENNIFCKNGIIKKQ